MNSKHMKRGRGSGVAGALLLAFATLGSGCSSESCPLYGCANPVTLLGNVVVAKEVTDVDFRFCVDKQCNEGSIELAQGNARMPCASWDLTGSRVCLTHSSEPQSFTLRADSVAHPENEHPPDFSVQLELVDHATGEVLLDETRIAKASVQRTDHCHHCWSAEATL